MAKIYMDRAENGMTAVTDERDAFVSYLLEHRPATAKELREFGVEQTLACCEPAEHQLWELIEKVADGDFEHGTKWDLTAAGLDALSEDFLDCGRDPNDDFCGITVWDKTSQEAADLVARMAHDIVRSELEEDDPGIEDDEDDEELLWAVMRMAVEKHDAKKERKE